MAKEEAAPSEKEWAIMEVLWEANGTLTSAEIIKRLHGTVNMTSKMVRVLINRLHQKKIIDYVQDGQDARVYHYFPLKSREECRKEKSKKFIDSYFSGNGANAFASLLESVTLTKGQIQELEGMLEQAKGKDGKGRG